MRLSFQRIKRAALIFRIPMELNLNATRSRTNDTGFSRELLRSLKRR
jgi:hypothetical protein